MHLAPHRKTHSSEYQTAAAPTVVCAALRRLSDAIPGLEVNQPAPDQARIEAPGLLIRVKMRVVAGWTLVAISFKECALWAWRKAMAVLHPILQLRRADCAPDTSAKETLSKKSPVSVWKVVNEFVDDQQKSRHVVFTSKAIQQAKDCVYWDGEALRDILERLYFAAQRMREGGHNGVTRATFFVKYVNLRGFRAHISHTQSTKFRDDYVAVHNGKEILGRMHVTIGSRHNEAGCMSVHFEYCQDCERIIITRCGKHGRTYHS